MHVICTTVLHQCFISKFCAHKIKLKYLQINASCNTTGSLRSVLGAKFLPKKDNRPYGFLLLSNKIHIRQESRIVKLSKSKLYTIVQDGKILIG